MSSQDVTCRLRRLEISGSKKNAPQADSWEEKAENISSEDEAASTPGRRPGTAEPPGAPPPTPSSPFSARDRDVSLQSFGALPSDGIWANAADASSSRGGGEKRPEKTTAVASRLIAAGLGQKAPQRTKEQREYDRAIKAQETKKRDRAREEEERKKREAEQAKKAMWDD